MADEKILLPGLIKALSGRFATPLSIDSNDSGAVEAGLWVYPGSPLVNSISGEPGKMETLGPLCKLFGAPFILLPIVGRKLPVTATERAGGHRGPAGRGRGAGHPPAADHG